ncbi:peptidoglycan DD-metalloendopeptidase family protein [Patescibacteria group bacterium]|nr:peptidoglycan DD-metalloendopeptidase family protein [Patescibacteria group bacterium]
MKRYKILFLLLVLFALVVVGVSPRAFVAAQDSATSDTDKVDDLEEKIEEYEEKISELQNEANTLSREISSADAQIQVTQLKIQSSTQKIQNTQKKILELVDDIKDLGLRIDKLGDSIAHQTDVLHQRQRARYKSREVVNVSPIMLFFGSDTVSELLQRTTYLRVMEEQDTNLLEDMRETKAAFGKQKGLFEEKKNEEENLKTQLEVEKANLDNYKFQLEDQKEEKKRLLDATQNDEEKYQDLLAEAQRELNQIVGAVSVLKGQAGVDVKKGQMIGTQGNSGYSSGDHLHFGVYKYSSFNDIDGWDWYYNNYVDPSKKLSSKTVYWNDGCSGAQNKSVGNGDWAWPLKSPTISQGFGKTCWSNIYYGGKVHPAYDMYGPYGSPVYAVDDGKAYFCDNCLGDGANGVFIFHDDDYMTVYWHLK